MIAVISQDRNIIVAGIVENTIWAFQNFDMLGVQKLYVLAFEQVELSVLRSISQSIQWLSSEGEDERARRHWRIHVNKVGMVRKYVFSVFRQFTERPTCYRCSMYEILKRNASYRRPLEWNE